MKGSTLGVLLLTICAMPAVAQDKAQDPAAAARAAAGCGPSEIKFDVKTDDKQHPTAQPEACKALVYVFEDIASGPTLKVGLDGAWVGANDGRSYFFFQVEPGEHCLCTNWQSMLKSLSGAGMAISLTAEAGKVYYFRTTINEPRNKEGVAVKMRPIDSAEAQFLIAVSAYSTSRAKK